MSKYIFNWQICRILLAACLSTVSLRALQIDAATIAVTNLNDSGPGSLRQVIADSSPGDTIEITVTGTIALTTGELLIDKDLTIAGLGADQLSVDGNFANSVFRISPDKTVSVSGLAIKFGSEDNEGDIHNAGLLALSNCILADENGSDTDPSEQQEEHPRTITFAESFDSGTLGLPAGWRATNVAGLPPLWAKSRTVPASPPCDAFVDDPRTISDKRLDSPRITIETPTARLSFLNNYDFDFDPEFFGGRPLDGGVLEISFGGGAFIDILAGGGSFTQGGYNGIIYGLGGNPLARRWAWCRTSHGYIATIVNLPAQAAGQDVQLRWRMGSNSFNSYFPAGWRIDDVRIDE